MRAALPLLALLALPLAAAHHGADEPGLRSASGGPAMVGQLVGLHAPGALVVAPWQAWRLDGHVDEYAQPALPAPGMAASFAQNGTHLAVALDVQGRGWFLLGLDLDTASRALIAMRESLVARHLAVGGWLDDAGNLTWCVGELGIVYPSPDAPAGHEGFAHGPEEVPVAWDRGLDGSCTIPTGLAVQASRGQGATRVEAAVPKGLLGARPGDVRHALLAFEQERRFLPPKVTEEATRGDLNVLLARPGDDPAALARLVGGAPDGADAAALLAVPAAGLLLGAALRRQLS
jgi:hypothetical protein